MARASFTTPVYFFSSIRAGSGKATIVANLAIFLNNLSQKVALIDLDFETPLKLKNAFPQSINLQTYADLAQIARSEDNRFQKNFYFTETAQISYFPAQKLSDPGVLFSDTSLRDFFIQLKASFDCVIINFPTGAKNCQKISELLSKSHLWRGSQPASLIVAQPDEKCLVALDKLLQQNPAFSYQLQENTCLLFNKVPASSAEQNLADTTLTTHELRQIFDQQRSYIIPDNEEFPEQRLQAGATVLRSDSLMHQTISGLHRLLSHTGEDPIRQLSIRPSDYQACLDGELLEKLTPYLEKIQLATAARLYVHPSELQVFLEEGPGNFRIRLRISGVTQPLLGISTKIRQEPECLIIQRRSPVAFKQAPLSGEQRRVLSVERETISLISMRRIYEFPDSFNWHPEAKLHSQLELLPEKSACPSPILFKSVFDLPEVPSLSHVLGFSRQQYRKFNFTSLEKYLTTGSVTHFFLPPEFELCYDKNCIFEESFSAVLTITNREKLSHSIIFRLAYHWPEVYDYQIPNFPDAFSRTQALVSEHDFLVRETLPIPADFAITKRKLFSFFLENSLWPVPYAFLSLSAATPSFQNVELPRILPLFDITTDTPQPEIQSKNNRISIQSSDAYKHFSLQVMQVAESYKMPPDKALNLQMQACLFLSLSNRDLIWRPAAPILPNSFVKDIRDFPETLAVSQANSQKIEQPISPPDIKLPESFVWEDLLMDHVYPDVQRLASEKTYSAKILKAENVFRPNHAIFFRQTFPESQAALPKSDISAPVPDFKLTCRALTSSLKKVEFKLSVIRVQLAFDLLQVKFRHKKDNTIRDASDQSIYRSDQVVDANLALRQLKPLRTSMLKINRQPADSINFAGPFINKKFTTANAKFEKVKLVLLSKAANTATISKNCHLDRLPTSLFSSYRPSITITSGRDFTASWMRKFQSRPAFNIGSYDLTTLTMRRDTQKFYSFPGKGISLAINYKPSITKRTFKLSSINGNQQEFRISHDQIKIPTFLPLRLRHNEFPTLESKIGDKLTLKIQRNMNVLSLQKGNLVENIREITDRSFQRDLRNTGFTVKYPLVLSAPRLLRSIAQKKINFFIKFPDPLEILFEHLRWALKSVRVSGMPFNKDFLRQKIDRASEVFPVLHHTPLPDQLGFYDRIHHQRLQQSSLRKIYPITNLRLRDLMNFARQANQKFNEINQKIRT